MAQIYTKNRMKRIVEDDTNFEYSLLKIDDKVKKHSDSTKKNKRMMTIRHNVCGHEYTLDIYEFIHGKRRCAKCVKGKKLNAHFSFTLKEIVDKTDEITAGEYSFVDKNYHNANTLHKYQHNTCKTVFKKKWNKFRVGQRCPECYRLGMDSMASRYVKDILEYYKIEFKAEKKFADCINPKTSKQLPFDYYIEKNKILIEVDGEQHDRPSYGKDTFEGIKQRDAIKTNYAHDNGFELIRIPAKYFNKVPQYMAMILSKILNRTITTQKVSEVQQSSHLERIQKDMKYIHNGEYQFNDNYYSGMDRKHKFTHKKCGTVFTSTLYLVKFYKDPCEVCREENQKQRKFKKKAIELYEKTNGKYSLVTTDMTIANGKRLVKCNKCKHQWYVNISAIYSNNGGCPNCHKIKAITQWKIKYKEVCHLRKTGKKLSRSLHHWLWYNKNLCNKGVIEPYKQRLLQKANIDIS